jgi:hypothetical protein
MGSVSFIVWEGMGFGDEGGGRESHYWNSFSAWRLVMLWVLRERLCEGRTGMRSASS